MVKSSAGTEAAMLPMWTSSSSLMPVGGQVMLLDCPSSVKKPADTQIGHGSDYTGVLALGGGSEEEDYSPGHGESSQCLMWRIFSSLERA